LFLGVVENRHFDILGNEHANAWEHRNGHSVALFEFYVEGVVFVWLVALGLALEGGGNDSLHASAGCLDDFALGRADGLPAGGGEGDEGGEAYQKLADRAEVGKEGVHGYSKVIRSSGY